MGIVDTVATGTQTPEATGGWLGKTVGSYLVVEKLGEGGMAHVYKAYHTRLGRYVALKFVRPELTMQPNFRHAFEREARTLARFSHPHIVHIYDVGETQGAMPQPYLVMEYIAGRTLKAWLPEHGTLSLEQALPILRQVSTALDYAHAQGTIHRDIKPGNIMLTPDGRALLADFGISRLLGPGQEFVETQSTTGTPAYMAPEQVSPDAGPIGPACDIYALGVVAYEMLTGHRPFSGESPLVEMVKRLQEPPTPPRAYNPALSEAVEQVLLQALAKNPADRYPRAGVLIAALMQAAPGIALPETPNGELLVTPSWWPTAPTDVPPEPGPAPFKGLQYLDVSDAALLFGRETVVARLLERLVAAPNAEKGQSGDNFLAIVGASGSGKSSLARAGLIPALPAGQPVYITTPTASPLEALALCMTRDATSVRAAAVLLDDMAADPRSLHLYAQKQMTSDERRVAAPQVLDHPAVGVLVVDQFEELFTLCHDLAARRAFIDNLLTAADAGSLRVVITLRADFYHHCAQYPNLRDALALHQMYIGPMTPVELRRAIEEPARRGDWAFEPGLVDLLLHEVGDEPGGLPLLAHALLETWQRRRGRTLTLGGYAEAGGVRGAIARTAEAVYQRLEPTQQVIARNIFMRLTELGDGTQDTRRRASLRELVPPGVESAEVVHAVLNELAAARLITLEQDNAQVAHEALIREWPTLRMWLEEDREGLRIQRHLTEAAQAWERLERDPGELYRGARLAQAVEWMQYQQASQVMDTCEFLTPLECDFLAESQEELHRIEMEREAQRQRELVAARQLAESEKRRAVERTRWVRWIGVAAALLLLATVAAIVLGVQAKDAQGVAETRQIEAENAQSTAVAERARAEQQTQIVLARQLEVQAQYVMDKLPTELPRAALLAVESLQRHPESAAIQTLGEALALLPHEVAQVIHPIGVTTIAFNPDGRWGASADWNGVVEVWETLTGKEVLSITHENEVYSVAFSPDGQWGASGGLDGTAQVWEAKPGGQVVLSMLHAGGVQVVAFSPDSKRVATAGCDVTDEDGVCLQGSVQVRELATGREVTTMKHDGRVYAMAFSPDGKSILSGSEDGVVRLWEVKPGGQEIFSTSQEGDIRAVAFSPDGQWIAAGGCNQRVDEWTCLQGTAWVWAAATGREAVVTTRAGELSAIDFSPDSQWVAMGGDDGMVQVWEVATGEEIARLMHEATVFVVDFSQNGRRLASSSWDGTARVWDTLTWREDARMQHTNGVFAIAFNPDNQHVASGDDDGVVRIWEVAFKYEQEGDVTAAFSPNGEWIVSGGTDGVVRIWEVATGREVLSMTHKVAVSLVAFSPDGSQLLIGNKEGTVGVWEIATGLEVAQTTHKEGAYDAVFSPDGKWIASTGCDLIESDSCASGPTRVWEASTGLEVTQSPRAGEGGTVAFSPDGRWVISAGCDDLYCDNGSVTIWDIETAQEVRRLSRVGYIDAAVFSPNGQWVATGSWEGIAWVWEARTGNEVAQMTHEGEVTTVAFNSDGQWVVSGDENGTVRVWEAMTGNEVARMTYGGVVKKVAFSPDDSAILATGCEQYNDLGRCISGSVRIWRWRTEDLIELACTNITRNLTREEWQQYLGEESYRATCPSLPVEE